MKAKALDCRFRISLKPDSFDRVAGVTVLLRDTIVAELVRFARGEKEVRLSLPRHPSNEYPLKLVPYDAADEYGRLPIGRSNDEQRSVTGSDRLSVSVADVEFHAPASDSRYKEAIIAAGQAASIALFAYLIYALLKPEKF